MTLVRFVLSILLVSAGYSWGSLISKGEFEYITENEEMKIRVKDNGERIIHKKSRVKVSRESGVKHLKLITIPYDEATQKIKIVKSSVTNGKKTYEVPIQDIVDRYLLLPEHGFDGIKAVEISFPEVKVGSVLSLEEKKTEKDITDPSHFSEVFFFGVGSYEESKSIEIVSDREVFYKISDPWRTLFVNTEKSDGKFILTIKLKRPFGGLGLEQLFGINLSKLSFVAVSTDKDWNRIVKINRLAYEKVISSPLPETLKKISEKIMRKKDLSEKINTLFIEMTKHYNYIYGWRAVKGRYEPRGFAAMEKTGVGDSKDMASAMVAILRKSQIDAEIALAGKYLLGKEGRYGKDQLVLNRNWMSALVYIKHKGREYWLNPSCKYFCGISIDDFIASLDGLILKEGQSQLTRIPKTRPEDHAVKIKQNYYFKNIKKASVEGRLDLSGRFARILVGAGRRADKSFIEKFVMNFITSKEEKVFPVVYFKKLKDFPLANPNISFKYTANKATREKENAFLFDLPILEILSKLKIKKEDREKRIADLYLEPVFTLDREVIFHNVSFSGEREVSCYIDSEWFLLSRDMDQRGDSVHYREKFILKEAGIKSEDLRGTEFQVLVDQISKCRQKSVLALSDKKNAPQKAKISLSKLFGDLSINQRVLERKKIARKLLSERRTNDISEYELSDACELMKINKKEMPSDEESRILLSSLLLKTGEEEKSDDLILKNLQEANHAIDSALKDIGETSHLLLKKAQLVFIVEKDRLGALEILNKSIEQNKKRDELFLKLLADTYRLFQDDENYLKIMNELTKKEERKEKMIDYYLNLSRYYFEKNLWGDCIKYYRLYLDEIGNDYLSHGQIGRCYREKKKFDQSIDHYKKSLSLKKTDESKKGLARSYLAKGQTLLFEKSLSLAKSTLHRSIVIHPFADSHYKLALVDLMQGNFKEVLVDINKFIEVDKEERGAETRNGGIVLLEILELSWSIDREQSLNHAREFLKEIENLEKKFFVATFLMKALFEQSEQKKGEMLKVFSLVQSIEKSQPNLIQENSHAKVYLAGAYFFASLLKNDIVLFEQSVELFQSVKKVKKIESMVNFLGEKISQVNKRLGIKPNSFYWKAKRQLHLWFREYFSYELLTLGTDSI